MKPVILMLVAAALCAAVACKNKQANTGNTNTGPPTIVYKTKADYSKNVPVTLSADKTQIVGYPATKDVYRNGALAYPAALKNGYWLDNRGIGPNSAFLKITYDDYAKLGEVPALTELYKLLIDKDPFTEIYNLGDRNRFKNEVEEINEIINKGGLKKFTKVK